MEKKSLSGAAKRKRKRESEESLKESLSKTPKLTMFFASKNAVPSDDTLRVSPTPTEADGTIISTSTTSSILPEDHTDVGIEGQGRHVYELHTMASPVALTCNETTISLESLVHEEHPSDIAHYPATITVDMRRFVLDHGSCRPRGPFPKNQKNRSFSNSYYTTVNKSGLKIERSWLCYSPKLDMVYCEPCWLFSRTLNKSRWMHGINDWQNLSQKIKDHEGNSSHTEACYAKKICLSNKSLDQDLQDQMRKEHSFWRKVLERIIKITLKLAKNAVAFRGHRENFKETYNGNFLSDVKLLAEYDDTLRQVLSLPAGSTKYLSPQIQNEVIECLGDHLKRELLAEIKSSPFFSIIADTTQDISKKDQLSITFRFVNIVKDDVTDEKPTKLEIKETFLGFIHLSGQSAAEITSTICDILHGNGLDLSKCRGQGYDGASVMSGVYSGVQARIQEMEPKASYVHCAAHNLNLVVNDAVNGIEKIQRYFAVLQSIYVFFGHSINRWDLLSSFTGESVVTLKTLNPTRWSGRLQSLIAIKQRYTDVLKALNRIILESNKKDEKSEAARVKQNMENFEFVVITVLLEKILSVVYAASMQLQRKDLDIAQAAKQIEASYCATKELRNQFDGTIAEAESIAQKWGTVTEFKNSRTRIHRKFHQELAEDYRFADAKESFRVNVFYGVLDIVISQLKNRFEGLRKVAELFLFLTPTRLLSATDEETKTNTLQVQAQYPTDLSDALPLQLLLCVKTLRPEIEKIHTIRELAELIIIKFYDMSSSFSEVYSLLFLFLTIPVTVASAERSFSKLKIIKNYLRNSMGQERLSQLALLSIEARKAERMDVSKLIDDFASAKSRKKTF